MPFAWSPAALDQIYRLYVLERRSAAETAQALGQGVTRNAVLGKVQRLGWTRPDAPKVGGPLEPRGPKPAPTPRPTRRTGGPFARVLALPKLQEAPETGTPRLWTEREAGQCAYPVGEAAEPGRQYACCAPVEGCGTYCPAHRALMFVEGTALTPKDEDAIVRMARRAA
jgi:GcrA cell cycle regulator